MKEIKRTVFVKEGHNWKETFSTTDQAEIYKSLSHDMEAKLICKCSYITRIKSVTNYDGTHDVTVWYDNNCKSVYTVE